MVNCSYCGKEFERNVFCSPSHKVMFNKKGKKINQSLIVNDTLTPKKKLTKGKLQEKIKKEVEIVKEKVDEGAWGNEYG